MLEINETINHRYVIEKIIGNGTFGNVYKAKCKKKELFYAVKTEPSSAAYTTLTHECNILKYLYDNRCRSIPYISWYGIHRDSFCLITPLYDMTLTDYLCERKLPLASVHKLFPKLITLIQTIHELRVIHRDIKPDNFMVKDGELFLIDFGLANVYIDDQSNHVENVQQTEKDLKKIFPKDSWNKLHLQIIFWGREFCQAQQCHGITCKICKATFPKRSRPFSHKKP